MSIKSQIALIAVVCAVAPAWAVNKCAINGKVVYQDAPCAGSGITVAEDIERRREVERAKAVPASPAGQSAAGASLPPDVQKLLQDSLQRTEQTMVKARANCKGGVLEYPVIGMTETDFKNCTTFGLLVEPKTVNETETRAGVSRQYVYDRTERIRYLYTRNGVVSAIQR